MIDLGTEVEEEDDVPVNDPSLSAVESRQVSDVHRNSTEFKCLHRPGNPVLVVHVHDLLTASIAAEQPEVEALCVDLPTVRYLVGGREANRDEFLFKDAFDLINYVALIAQRNGKLLTVDMRT